VLWVISNKMSVYTVSLMCCSPNALCEPFLSHVHTRRHPINTEDLKLADLRHNNPLLAGDDIILHNIKNASTKLHLTAPLNNGHRELLVGHMLEKCTWPLTAPRPGTEWTIDTADRSVAVTIISQSAETWEKTSQNRTRRLVGEHQLRQSLTRDWFHSSVMQIISWNQQYKYQGMLFTDITSGAANRTGTRDSIIVGYI
jgi:hypothetical protein